MFSCSLYGTIAIGEVSFFKLNIFGGRTVYDKQAKKMENLLPRSVFHAAGGFNGYFLFFISFS